MERPQAGLARASDRARNPQATRRETREVDRAEDVSQRESSHHGTTGSALARLRWVTRGRSADWGHHVTFQRARHAGDRRTTARKVIPLRAAGGSTPARGTCSALPTNSAGLRYVGFALAVCVPDGPGHLARMDAFDEMRLDVL